MQSPAAPGPHKGSWKEFPVMSTPKRGDRGRNRNAESRIALKNAKNPQERKNF